MKDIYIKFFAIFLIVLGVILAFSGMLVNFFFASNGRFNIPIIFTLFAIGFVLATIGSTLMKLHKKKIITSQFEHYKTFTDVITDAQKPKTITCEYCGTKTKDNETICPSCGAKLK